MTLSNISYSCSVPLIHHQNFSGNQNQISTCKTKPAIRCSPTGFLLYSVFSSLGPHTLTSSQNSVVTLERLWTLSLEPTSKSSKWYCSKGRASSAALCNKKPLKTSGQVRRLVLKIPETGSLLKMSQVFSSSRAKNYLSASPSGKFPNVSLCSHQFVGDSI